MEFVLISPGDFLMGSPASEPSREPQEVQHRVRISRAFYAGRYEVTQSQWQRVMGSNPSWFKKCGPDCPVERVSWNQIQTFIALLATLPPRNRNGPIFVTTLDPQGRELLRERLEHRLEPGTDRRIQLKARAWAVRGLA